MKRVTWLTILMVMVLVLDGIGAAHAEIIPPHGEGQIGLQAVVLCEKLTLRKDPDTASKALETLRYGDLPVVMEQRNGWAYITVDDSEDSAIGWVNADYLAIDPAWYRTEQKTQVYAWNDLSAPKVALLDKNATLPILRQDGEWLVVSLRGAVGWVHM